MAYSGGQRLDYCTPEELSRASKTTRKLTLRQCLVQPDPVIIHPLFEWNAFNPEVSSGLLLLRDLAKRTDALGMIIATEAREIFYAENEFLVWWDGLHEFLRPFSWERLGESDVGKLIRKIVVRYDMRDTSHKARELTTELEHLFRLTGAQQVVIELQGSGTAEGSDIATQTVIQRIAVTVKALIDYFGEVFTIHKVIGGWVLLNAAEVSSLRSYWDSPSEAARERASRSQATFEEIMQIQVERWIGAQTVSNSSLAILGQEGGQTFLTADLSGYPV